MEAQLAQLSKDIATGWKVSGLGLLAVFGVLIMFYILIKLMLKMFPERGEE